METKLMDGRLVAKQIRERVKAKVDALSRQNKALTLAILRVGEDKGSFYYEKALKKEMEKVGILTTSQYFEETTPQQEIIDAIEAYNKKTSVTGILVLQPFPEGYHSEEILRHIDPKKDIDGLHATNLGRLMKRDEAGLIPTTPQAVIELLDAYQIEVEGKDIALLGASPVVGRPLSMMLLNRQATVTVCHTLTKDLSFFTKHADIVISATGALEYFDSSYIKEGSIVIDVGYGSIDGRLTGDFKTETLEGIASLVTPVPGGVGSVTSVLIGQQLLKAYDSQGETLKEGI